jgi:hypothetical protein
MLSLEQFCRSPSCNQEATADSKSVETATLPEPPIPVLPATAYPYPAYILVPVGPGAVLPQQYRGHAESTVDFGSTSASQLRCYQDPTSQSAFQPGIGEANLGEVDLTSIFGSDFDPQEPAPYSLP